MSPFEHGRGIAIAAVLLFFGFAFWINAYTTLGQWSSISPWYAACGLLWALAAAAMIPAGLWLLGSLGRHRLPLWIGGAAAILAGAVLVIGVLTYVVPCAGPS